MGLKRRSAEKKCLKKGNGRKKGRKRGAAEKKCLKIELLGWKRTEKFYFCYVVCIKWVEKGWFLSQNV